LSGGQSAQANLGRRATVLFLAVAAYAIALLAFVGRVQHVYFYLLTAQYALLLPVFLYFVRPGPRGESTLGLPGIPLRWIVAPFLAMAAITSWYVTPGITVPDESSYRFQGLIFASGRLWADAPPGAGTRISEIPPPLYFEHILLVGQKWYSQIPPGWPAVLAPALKLHAEWLMSPVFGALLLAITAATARLIFGDGRTGALAALMMALSPYYLTNSVGIMTHAFCGALIAGAIWLCFEGVRSRRLNRFAGMFFLLSVACLTRYFTGAVMAATLGLVALWCVRRDRNLLLRTALVGMLFAALILAAILVYNHTYTGSYLVSPYSLVVNTRVPFYKMPQLSFSPGVIWDNILHDRRWGAQRTLFYTSPFLLLLAGYGVLREHKFTTEVRILALLSICLVAAYQIEIENSAAINGERYYFEVFGAVAILAARGLALLAENWRIPVKRVAIALAALAGLQICEHGVAIDGLVSRTAVQRRIRAAAARLTGARRAAFLSEALPFPPKHFFLDGPDWRSADLMFMVDPGPAGRQEWTCRMGRSQWVVFGYDASAGSVTQEFGSAASGGCPRL
jgi:Dolichyl-phosphate-mannose-protein mannosyltransferase